MLKRFLPLIVLLLASPLAAQQKVGHVDSQSVLDKLPEFQSVKQEIERLATQYEGEVDALDREAEALEREFAGRELLYTDQERQAKQGEIRAKHQESVALRRRYFGPQGELVRDQQQRLRPIQERVLEAVESVADAEGYDYVLDRSGEVVFLFAKPQHDLTEHVLDELGVNTSASGGAAPGRN